MTESPPIGWAETDVGTICDVVGGGTPSTKRAEYWSGVIPWISSADIYGINDIRSRRRINELAVGASTTNLVPRGSIVVVTRVGLGKVAIVEEPLCFSQDSQGLVFSASLLHGLFLTYYLSQAVQRFRYEGRGTTITGVTQETTSSITCPSPTPPRTGTHRRGDREAVHPARRFRRRAEAGAGQPEAVPGQRPQGSLRGHACPHGGGACPGRRP